MHFHDVQADAGKKKDNSANARRFREKRRRLGPEQRLDIPAAKTGTSETLPTTRLEQDHEDQYKANNNVNKDQKQTHDTTPASWTAWASWMICANDSALSDAPPTSAPSILGFPMSARVLSGFTLPP